MRKTLIASGIGFALMATAATAQDIIQSILGGADYDGAEVLETKSSFFGIKIQVVMPDGTVVTRVYRKNGTLRAEVAEKDGVRSSKSYTASGTEVDVAQARSTFTNSSDDGGGSGELDGCAPDQC